jgi:glycosyltransferase involved in cell wall biosynthesis
MRIVFSTPTWIISGVNSFTLNLMRGLQSRGHEVELLVIRQGNAEAAELPWPNDVSVKFLEWNREQSWWMARWEALRDYLQARSTVYFPNYDFENSSVAPALRNEVGVIGVVHSDDPHHYEHVQSLGRYWNAVISVSSFLHANTLRLDRALDDRAFHIPYGVCHDPAPPRSRRRGHETIRIVFSGRFNEEQKRVSDLAKIGHGLKDRGIPFHLTLIGNGPSEADLKAAVQPLVDQGCADFPAPMINDEILPLYVDYDCFVLTSNYEGLPLALLESMARGCIPIVTDLASGIPDVIRHGENGFILPRGDIASFLECLDGLQKDRGRRQLVSDRAFKTIATGPFGIDTVVDRYDEVIDFVRRNIESGHYVRPKPFRPNGWAGDFMPPAALQISPDAYYSLKWQSDRQAQELAALKQQLAAAEATPFEYVLQSKASLFRRLLGAPRRGSQR